MSNGDFYISTDSAALNIDLIHDYLKVPNPALYGR
jgi:hypothetical protein